MDVHVRMDEGRPRPSTSWCAPADQPGGKAVFPVARSRSRKRTDRPALREDRRSVAVTVAWMMSVLATLLALASSLVLLAVVGVLDNGPDNKRLEMLPGLLLSIACITSVGCLGLIPLVLRLRPDPPPRAILVSAGLIGCSPWVTILVMRVLEVQGP